MQVFLALDITTDLRDLAFLNALLSSKDWGKESQSLFKVICHQVSCPIQQQILTFPSLVLAADVVKETEQSSGCSSHTSPGSMPDRLGFSSPITHNWRLGKVIPENQSAILDPSFLQDHIPWDSSKQLACGLLCCLFKRHPSDCSCSWASGHVNMRLLPVVWRRSHLLLHPNQAVWSWRPQHNPCWIACPCWYAHTMPMCHSQLAHHPSPGKAPHMPVTLLRQLPPSPACTCQSQHSHCGSLPAMSVWPQWNHSPATAHRLLTPPLCSPQCNP